jgi:predicted nucleic-acid-binding protein
MKQLYLVDDDIFLKFFIQEDEIEAKRIRLFFEKVVSGEIKAFTTTHVIISVADKLRELYGWPKEEIATNIRLILSTPNLKVNYRDVLNSALNLYESHDISFHTAYHIEVMKRMTTNYYFSSKNDYKKLDELKNWSDAK